MERKTVNCRREPIEYFNEYFSECAVNDPVLINIRGCNGSGKSTIPLMMHSCKSIILTMEGKDVATFFPDYKIIAIGTYRNKTGGLDTFGTNEMTEKVLNMLCTTGCNIIAEGVISSTIKSTYATLFSNIQSVHGYTSHIMLLLPPVEVCLQRIQQRNGGKEIDEELVKSKWRTVERQYEFFKDAGFNVWKSDNSVIAKAETLDWFYGELQSNGVNL